VTDAGWETLSDQAVAVAGVVYFLALLSHLVEWSALRHVPVGRKERARTAVGVGPGSDTTHIDAGPVEQSPDHASERHRAALFGRLGLLLTVIAAGVHLVSLVGRGMAADPNRVPWGNMYEFTLAGTFFVTLGYLVLLRRNKWEWLAPIVVGFVLALLDDRRGLAAHVGGPAARSATLTVAGDPRRLRSDRHRWIHPRRDVVDPLPGQDPSR
jgi:hypothetical protein